MKSGFVNTLLLPILLHILLVCILTLLTDGAISPGKRPSSVPRLKKLGVVPRASGASLGRAGKRGMDLLRRQNSSVQQFKPGFNLVYPTSTTWVNVGALVTVFAADKKTFLSVPSYCPGHPDAFFKEKSIYTLSMGTNGPKTLCSGTDPTGNLFIIIAEQTIDLSFYSCTSATSETGCERKSFWWSVWYKWYSDLDKMGITADDVRLNRWVLMNASEYAHMVRIFWRAIHDNDLPAESTAVHSIHGHFMPKTPVRVPLVSRGGGAFGSPIWHENSDPCVKDTLDILYRYKNIIARPCTPMVYDGSGFYISEPDKLSSTVFFDCDHTCGFRHYFGTGTRGQIIAYRSWKSNLPNRNQIAGAILDGY